MARLAGGPTRWRLDPLQTSRIFRVTPNGTRIASSRNALCGHAACRYQETNCICGKSRLTNGHRLLSKDG